MSYPGLSKASVPVEMAATYRFLTLWLLEAPVESVWDAMVNYQDLPGWWQAVKQVRQMDAGQADGTGSVWQMIWTTPLGYSLAFR